MTQLQPKSFRDRLGMIDEKGERIEIIPARPKGIWAKRRTLVHSFLIALFLVLPWIKIKGSPAVLLDIPNRHFSILGFEFWAHDAPMIFFVLGIATLSLALVTAVYGRVWCGWACPQTVFLDGVFRRIEEWVEGNHLKRRELNAAPMSLSKFIKKSLKWSLFVLFTLIITHSFLAYFVGPERVFQMVTHSPKENWENFVFVMVLSGIFLFDLAWFREQFCVIMCPYGRFQSVLYDRYTITVQYDESRGEPRKGVPLAQGQKNGDCVNCGRCVQVCPTGIDIRNGIQMECIACTACIDACDEIMEKLSKPKGLIRYMPSVQGAQFKLWRPRVMAYLFVLLAIVTGLFVVLINRPKLHLQVLRAIDVPYFEKVENNTHYIVNSYRLHVKNQTPSSQKLKITFVNHDEALKKGWKLQIPEHILEFKAGDFKMIPFLIEIPRHDIPTHGSLSLEIKVNELTKSLNFLGPKKHEY
ncbi:MAG: cytochrome c oxidase accessory protein CcoG [Bdellovibrionaceae bacterium]|nr:cytochrome c oxidase accessory protein CcoG [Pseudobdellovibrionaceae bacterium]MDW8190191.1 cytochrome c oxidase accessory protein CcoG [Pseudobdellovibrionaceae bacterium]